jgi:TonB family protein
MFSNHLSKNIALFFAVALHLCAILILFKLHRHDVNRGRSNETQNYLIVSTPNNPETKPSSQSHSSTRSTPSTITHRTKPTLLEPEQTQSPHVEDENINDNVNINESISSQTHQPHENPHLSTSQPTSQPSATEKISKKMLATSDISPQAPNYQRATPLITNPQPIYPASAKRRQQQGTVTVTVTVNKQGYVSQLNVSHSSGFSVLDQSVLQTVARWQFKAALQNGLPADDLITLSFDFYLNP